MPRFFIDRPADEFITVTGGDARHIGYSLRMKTGDGIVFCHGGIEYHSIIDTMTENEVICRVESTCAVAAEPDIKLTLYQAYPKQDKLELIIQKTTELGISRIVPFISERCVARPERTAFEKKKERLERIAKEAAMQSGRGAIPEIAPLMSVKEALSLMEKEDVRLFCYENGGVPLSADVLSGGRNIGVMIGSEGGFSINEAESAKRAGAAHIYLGKRILRCETCPIAVTAVIMNLTGNM